MATDVFTDEVMLPISEDFEKENKDSDKKKRNSRKRNRCDMSPEELQRLRERERKAQQSRRDRIRAQKLLQQKNERTLPAPATMVNMSTDIPQNDFQGTENGLPALMKVHGSSPMDLERASIKSSETSLRNGGDKDSYEAREKTSIAVSPKFESHPHQNSPERRYHHSSSERTRHSPHGHISPSSYLPVSSSRMFDHVIPRSYSHRYLDEGRFLADLNYEAAYRAHRHAEYKDYKDLSMEKSIYPFYHDEKKRMVSRNVDRKKLSEEELEDLRRRERDYQRERRARIRLEKAKSSIEDDGYYRHHHRESFLHPDDHYCQKYYDYTKYFERPVYSPHSPPSKKLDKYHPGDSYHIRRESEYSSSQKYPQVKRRVSPVTDTADLSVAIPRNKPSNEEENEKETELLQVVPKNRDYEHMKSTSPEFHLKASSSPVSANGGEKKTALENICTSLKKETTSAKKITEDQLERRRKSNREAQRRRRARLKMIEERPNSRIDNSSESVASDGVSLNSSYEEERFGKRCRVKNTPNRSERPDSLYPEDFAYYPNDRYFSPVMKEIQSRKYAYDMKNHREYTPHVVPVIPREYPAHENAILYKRHRSPTYHSYHHYPKEKDFHVREMKEEESVNTEGKSRKRKQCIPRKLVCSERNTDTHTQNEEDFHDVNSESEKSPDQEGQYRPSVVESPDQESHCRPSVEFPDQQSHYRPPAESPDHSGIKILPNDMDEMNYDDSVIDKFGNYDESKESDEELQIDVESKDDDDNVIDDVIPSPESHSSDI